MKKQSNLSFCFCHFSYYIQKRSFVKSVFENFAGEGEEKCKKRKEGRKNVKKSPSPVMAAVK